MKQITVEHYPIRALIITDIQPGELTSFDQIPDTALRFASKKDGKIWSAYIKLEKFEDVKDKDLSTQFASSIVAEKLLTAIEEAIVKERVFGPAEEDNQFDYGVNVNGFGSSYPVSDDDSGQVLTAADAKRRWLWNSASDLNNRIASVMQKSSSNSNVILPNFATPFDSGGPSFELTLIEPKHANQQHRIRIIMRYQSRVMVTLEPKELKDHPYNRPGQFGGLYGSSQREINIQLRGLELVAKVTLMGLVSQEAQAWFSDETLKSLVLEMASKGLGQYVATLSSFNFNESA